MNGVQITAIILILTVTLLKVVVYDGIIMDFVNKYANEEHVKKHY